MTIGGQTFGDDELRELLRLSDLSALVIGIPARQYRQQQMLQKAVAAGLLVVQNQPVVTRDLRNPQPPNVIRLALTPAFVDLKMGQQQ